MNVFYFPRFLQVFQVHCRPDTRIRETLVSSDKTKAGCVLFCKYVELFNNQFFNRSGLRLLSVAKTRLKKSAYIISNNMNIVNALPLNFSINELFDIASKNMSNIGELIITLCVILSLLLISGTKINNYM